MFLCEIYGLEKGKEAFVGDELVQTWVVHHLQIIGEAASRLTAEFKEETAEIPWKQIIGMRNILIHGYFEIDCNVVWKVIEKDIPPLKQHIKKILED